MSKFMKKSTLTKIIREEIIRALVEAETSKGPNDPTGDDEFDAASDAAKTAHDLNLVHTAYGRYQDPKHPEKGTVAQSVKGHLVKVEPKDAEPEVPGASAATPKGPVSDPNQQGIPGGAIEKPDVFRATSAPSNDTTTPEKSLHPEASSTLSQYMASTGGNSEMAKQKIEKVLKSLDIQAKVIQMRGKHALKTKAWQNVQNQIAKHRDALVAADKHQPSTSTETPPPPPQTTPLTGEPEVPGAPSTPVDNGVRTSVKPPQEPGKGNPPLQQNGDPWEVDVDGKRGYIDTIEKDRDEAHVTFHDGSYAWVRTDKLKPVNKTPTVEPSKVEPLSNDPQTQMNNVIDKILKQNGDDTNKALQFVDARIKEHQKNVQKRSSASARSRAPEQLKYEKHMVMHYEKIKQAITDRAQGQGAPPKAP